MKTTDLNKLKIGTRAIVASGEFDYSKVRSHIPPLFQTVNFEYEDVEEGLAIFSRKQPGYIYTRYSNPTIDLFGKVVAEIEEAEHHAAAASGMAAISGVALSFLKPGDHIVSSKQIYGGTYTFFQQRLNDLNIQTTFVDITRPDEIVKAITPQSKMLYTEVLGNPNLVVADIAKLAEIAHTHHLFFVVDNTFTPPPIIQPLKLQADIVMHSATKYIGGHGDLIGGIVLGSKELVDKVRQTIEYYGGALSPFNAWLALRGIKTLGIRIERQCHNASAIATFLNGHAKVVKVHYPGLKDHPQHDLANQQMHGFGAMVSFELKGGFAAGKRLMDAVRVCHFTVSLGEIDTLIIHPASTSHVGLNAAERQVLGISDGLVRLSVGIEDIDDLLDDLRQALDAVE